MMKRLADKLLTILAWLVFYAMCFTLVYIALLNYQTW